MLAGEAMAQDECLQMRPSENLVPHTADAWERSGAPQWSSPSAPRTHARTPYRTGWLYIPTRARGQPDKRLRRGRCGR